MPDNRKDALDKFWQRIEPLLYAYPKLEVRSLSYLSPEDRYNIYTTLRVSSLPFEKPLRQEIHAGEKFRILIQDVPSADLASIIEGLQSDQLVVGEDRIQVSTPRRHGHDGPATVGPTHWHSWTEWDRSELWDGRMASIEAVPSSRVEANGGQADEFVPQDDWQTLTPALLSLHPPILGTQDLFKRVLRAHSNHSPGHYGVMSIDVQWGCSVTRASIANAEELSLLVEVPVAIRPDHIRVSGLLSDSKKWSWSAEGIIESSREDIGDGKGLAIVRLPIGKASTAVVHVLLNDRVVARAPYDLPCRDLRNPMFAAMSTLEDATRQLSQGFADPGKFYRDPGGFEAAVANLFSLTGFVTMPIGLKSVKLGDSPDLFARDPWSPSLFCVEVTWKVAVEKGKIAQLAHRAAEVARTLTGFHVRALLVVDQEDISSVASSQADELGVVVLALPDLRWMLRESEWDVGPSYFVRWLNGGQKLKLESERT